MKEFVFNFTFIFQIAVVLITMYYFVLSLFGLYKKKDDGAKYCNPEKRFALLVAAHDEEMVIGKIIESLKDIEYPKDMYDIFVIADNCSDKTAAIAREYNVNVYERNVPDKRGKGYALEWMFNKIFKMDKFYDAVAIFDADNLVSRNFLNEMNYKMMEGYKVVQGYIDSKNPDDSWITESYSISFWTVNRLFQLARANLGLSNQIGGTGFCVDTSILKELGWGVTCLTEDLEFTCKLVLNGYKVGWAHNAIVYDEKPLTLKQSWNQRKRWMQGFTDVSSRFFFRLFKKAVRDRSLTALDCAFYTVQPFITLLMGIAAILTLIQNNHGSNIFVVNYLFTENGFTRMLWKLFSIFQFLFTPFIMLLERKLSKKMFYVFTLYSLNIIILSYIFVSPTFSQMLFGNAVYLLIFVLGIGITGKKRSIKLFIWYLLYGIYTLTWIPITIQGILDKNNKEWSHTKHIRQIGIQEVE
ncbi:glycosyltransferase family 2 protein [Clostridium sp. LBM24168]